MKWFREVFGLKNDNFSPSLNLYPDNDENEAKKYWSRITGLPVASFKKSQVDVRKNKKRILHNKLEFGTIQIRVKANGNPEKGVKLFRRIKGWTKGIVDQV